MRETIRHTVIKSTAAAFKMRQTEHVTEDDDEPLYALGETDEVELKLVPAVSDVVLYKLGKTDVEAINRERAQSPFLRGAHNRVDEGEVYPMIIVRVWGDTAESAVNGQVMLDGPDTYWATSRMQGRDPGQFTYED